MDVVDALPVKEKDLLLMKYYQGLSDEEIASVIKIKPKSVHTYVARAKAHANELLDNWSWDV